MKKKEYEYDYAKISVPREFVKQVDIFIAKNGIKNRQKYFKQLAKDIEALDQQKNRKEAGFRFDFKF